MIKKEHPCLKQILKKQILSGTNELLSTSLESRSVILYGYISQDGLSRFKIDHDVNTVELSGYSLNHFYINKRTYDESAGSEFYILSKEQKGKYLDVAISREKYKQAKSFLSRPTCSIDDIKSVGGCIINSPLLPKEVPSHDILLNFLCDKNNPSHTDYNIAYSFLKDKYIPFAQKLGEFAGGAEVTIYIYKKQLYSVKSICAKGVNDSLSITSTKPPQIFNMPIVFL